MCGIYISEEYDEKIINMIKKRGLDFCNSIQINNLHLFSSVLSIRGFVSQPFATDSFTFLYNGEIYNNEQSDTIFIKTVLDRNIKEIFDDEFIKHLENYKKYYRGNSCNSDGECYEDRFIVSEYLQSFLKKVYADINEYQNEYALVIVYKFFVLFFKDDFGKKSLGLSENPFRLSSVRYDKELNNSYLYSYDLISKTVQSYYKMDTKLKYLNKYTDLINLYLCNNMKIDWDGFLRSFEDTFFTGKFEKPIENGMLEDINNLDYDIFDEMSEVSKFDTLMKISTKRRLNEDSMIVFFSGGIDSIIISLYLHLVSDISKPIFLLNTGFRDSFDRINGKKAFKELEKVFDTRIWKFIEIDLVKEDILEIKDEIEKLIYPKTSRMDFNIGVVLHYTSKKAREFGKVGYLGSGADEIFCGYSKYSKDFFKKDEYRMKMCLDIFTLSYHNLSRDDRIISNNNFEARMPFLDTDLVNYSFDLSKDLLVNDIENKIILRNVLKKYNLTNVSSFPKKAMQYGTGIKKIEKYIHK
ncbi:hypothetical protein P3W45_001388 [Vairimorpha bombi]|jgi:asparagine synthetase B (glutamine-hydrolysing)